MSRRNRFMKIAESVRERTNAELASEMSGLTPLTDAEIERIVPTKADKEALAELLAIVSSSTSHNTKVAAIRKNLSGFVKVGVRLLRATVIR